jgi:hypothetical protein
MLKIVVLTNNIKNYNGLQLLYRYTCRVLSLAFKRQEPRQRWNKKYANSTRRRLQLPDISKKPPLSQEKSHIRPFFIRRHG